MKTRWHSALVTALRARDADIQTVVDAGLRGKSDSIQLEWAALNGRALYTFNVSDFCKLHREYLDAGNHHAGIIVVPRQRYDLRQQIRQISDLLTQRTAEEMKDILYFL